MDCLIPVVKVIAAVVFLAFIYLVVRVVYAPPDDNLRPPF